MLVKLFLTMAVVWVLMNIIACWLDVNMESKFIVVLGWSTIITVLLGVASALQWIWFQENNYET